MKYAEFAEERNRSDFGIRTSGVDFHEAGKVDDVKLWKQFKSGKEEALIQIYRLNVNMLFNYGCQFTKERELVRDTVQEFFIELIRNKYNLGDTDSIKFYLMKSFRRKLVRALKKENKFVREDISLHPEGFMIEQTHELRFIKNQLSEQQRNILKHQFNLLPEKQREALLLYYYEGLSYQEIADLFEMTKVKSARVLVYRAINSLAKQLEGCRDHLLSLLLFLPLFNFIV